MLRIRKILFSLKALFRRNKLENELAEELCFHLEKEIEKNIAAGMDAQEARYTALRSFGGLEQVKEECRDVRGVRFIEALWQDVGYGIRILRKSPGFTIVATLTLALGIGANTAIFSVVDAVLLRPLPYEESDRLVWVATWFPSLEAEFLVSADYVEWQRENHVFEHFAAFPHNLGTSTLSAGEEPLQIGTAKVTANFLATFRVQPVLGRGFVSNDSKPASPKVTIISDGLWRRRFGGEAAVIGRQILLDGQPCAIIGVLPPGFRFPDQAKIEALLPQVFDPEVESKRERMGVWNAVGRLKPGISLALARAELETLLANAKRRFPEMYRDDVQLRVVPLQEHRVKNIRLTLLILLGAVGCVLLIACANVANLLMARAAVRQREIATRIALGARRLRIVCQLLTENVLLGLLGCACSLALVHAVVNSFVYMAPEQSIPRIEEVTVDTRVFTFALSLSLLSGMVFGLAPAFTALRTDVQRALKQSAGRSVVTHRRLNSLLVVTQLGISMLLLIIAGLLLQSLWRLLHHNIGFNRENVLVANIWLTGSRFQNANRDVFLLELTDKIKRIPGILSLALSDSLPPYGGRRLATFARQDRPLPEPWHRGDNVHVRGVSPEYFRTMGIPVKKGRFFDTVDERGSNKVTIVNETVVRRYFPNEDPIEKRIDGIGGGAWKAIVGIVADVKNQGLNAAIEAEIYVPYVLYPEDHALNLIVRTLGEPSLVISAIRSEIHAVDPRMLVTFSTMDQQISQITAGPRFNTILLSTFAAVALVLALIGIYGVVAYTVNQRTQEIGIRLALGAQNSDILMMLLVQEMRWVLAGVGLGLTAGLGVTRVLASMLFEVSATDPTTFAGASVLLISAALLACFVPARHATKVDPMRVLRNE